MPLRIAKHAGFCMGVRHAVEEALNTAENCKKSGAACFSLGDLINNPLVVEDLKAQGVQPISSPEEAEGGVLIIRSHGVARATAMAARMSAARVVDCTCRFVTSMHRLVEDFSRDGLPVILIGDASHPEMVGTAGWCRGSVHVVGSEEDIAALPQSAEKALVVSQTTFPPERFEALAHALLSRFPALTVRNTICSATRLRQQEAAEMAGQCDRMIVVGGRGSANTRKLYETCLRYCKNTYLVERAAELPSHLMQPTREIIGITAGASTPDWSLKEVVESMNDIERQDQADPTVTQEPVAPEAPQEEAPAAEKSFMDAVEDSFNPVRPGQTVEGKVVQITDDEVCVNIGYKFDGLIKRSEMVDKDVKLGDTIQVEVVKINHSDCNVILSQRNIINKKVWDELVAKHERGEYVEAVGKEAVKGGLLCSIDGVRAFVPASQLAQRYIDKIGQFVGQNMKLKIIELDNAKKRVVASRKAVLEEEGAKAKAEAWERLKEGEVVRGIVRRFASFGAFVDLGGVDGMIHVSDLSWNRTAAPQDVLTIGSEIDVLVLSLDRERERIQLGYKQLQSKPWDNIEEKYPVGSVLTRKVVRIRPFGAFIELEPGVDGLCHISQISHTRVGKVEDVLTPGQEVNVKVLGIDPEAKRISLSIREALEDNAFDYSQDIPGFEVAEDMPAAAEEAVEEVTGEAAPAAPEAPEAPEAPAEDAK